MHHCFDAVLLEEDDQLGLGTSEEVPFGSANSGPLQ
jgi:hypothetical protein